MVNGRLRLWPQFHRLDPFVFRQIDRKHERTIEVRTIRRNLKLAIHFHDQIGSPQRPSVGEFWPDGCFLGISFRTTGINPRQHFLFLFRGQTSVVRKHEIVIDRFPGRHVSAVDHCPNCLGPTAEIIMGQQGKRADLVRSVTDGTFFVDDWCNVCGKCRWRLVADNIRFRLAKDHRQWRKKECRGNGCNDFSDSVAKVVHVGRFLIFEWPAEILSPVLFG